MKKITLLLFSFLFTLGLSAQQQRVAEIDVQVSEITATTARLVATPNAETTIFHDGVITVAKYNQMGAEVALEYFKTSGDPLTEADDRVWENMKSETAYYAFAIGQNAEEVWGSATLVPFTTTQRVVGVTLGAITTTTVELSFAPTEICASYYFLISTAANMAELSANFNMSIQSIVRMFGIQKTAAHDHLFTKLDAGTEYTIYVSPMNTIGDILPIETIVFSTLLGGGSGVAQVNVQVSNITATSVRFIATPNDQTAVFHNGLITVAYYNEIGAEAAAEYFKNDGEPQYQTDDWTWGDLVPETAYYALAIGKNGEGVWGPVALLEFTTQSLVGVLNPEVQQSAISLFPSPGNGMFTFKSVNGNSGKISIYNLNGQLVHEQTVSGSESRINATDLNNGLYQVVFISENSAEIATQKLIISK